ncbi:MAG: nuclear transport factor 2 family protein [Nitriliruptoraceae bacterium]|nr:nuclear transport factor 2 family protein [Nitriliruptoraceae bacterium]
MRPEQRADQRVVEVIRLERELLRPEVRRQPDRVKELLHPDFEEFGASGVVWTAQTIAEHLASHEDRAGDPVVLEQPNATSLGPDAILLTYRATSGRHRSLRSSVWVRQDGTWRMLFHQGTHRKNALGSR